MAGAETVIEPGTAAYSSPATDRLAMWRIGITGGVVGILCYVGLTVLGLRVVTGRLSAH